MSIYFTTPPRNPTKWSPVPEPKVLIHRSALSPLNLSDVSSSGSFTSPLQPDPVWSPHKLTNRSGLDRSFQIGENEENKENSEQQNKEIKRMLQKDRFIEGILHLALPAALELDDLNVRPQQNKQVSNIRYIHYGKSALLDREFFKTVMFMTKKASKRKTFYTNLHLWFEM